MGSGSHPSVRKAWTDRRRVTALALAVFVLAMAVLGMWSTPPVWLRAARGLVMEGLEWLRNHWLTPGALAVLLAAAGLVLSYLQRRSERQRTEREESQRTSEAQAARVALLAANCWVDPATSELPRVSNVHDPVALGVHPAADLTDLDPQAPGDSAPSELELPTQVPVYVPRDLDARLDGVLARALAQGGLVLLRGDSTAGKSRTAFEAMRRLSGDMRLLVPTRRSSLRALLDGGLELYDVVVWLNDLERYLGADGLDVGILRRLVGSGGRRVLLLATMRASEYSKRSPERDRDRSSQEREVLRVERELLDQAVDLELPRRFSAAEQGRASERDWDPRIADAVARAGRYGLAEYIAAGPRLWLRWRNAQAVDNSLHEQVGAAVVTAALDCRRAGLTRPVPIPLLHQLFRDQAYLDPTVASRLDPDSFNQGLAWARIPVQATSALLTADSRGEVVFDYLLDRLQTDPGTPPVPMRVWECLLVDLSSDDAFSIGMAAYQSEQFEIAVEAWRVAADAGDHQVEHNLGLLYHEHGDLEEAAYWYRRAAEAGEVRAQNNLASLCSDRGDLQEAERWYRRAAGTGDPLPQFNLGLMLAKDGRSKEAEGWLRRAVTGGHQDAEPVLGIVLASLGELDEAEQIFRAAADRGKHLAEFPLGQLLAQTGRPTEAEPLLRRAADRGEHGAAYVLALLFAERGDDTEAERWYRRAADGGDHDAEYKLGLELFRRGSFGEAERWYRRAASGGQHDAEYALGTLLALRFQLKEAEDWLARAADSGNDRAEQLLGVLLAHRGDSKEAERRFRHAAEAGNHEAEQLLRDLFDLPDEPK
jgi:TPR repeat protein